MKRVVISTAVLALACAGLGQASAAPNGYKVTGGGQTLVGTTGAGNTIAFTAQSAGAEGADAKGQFQLQLRDGIKETVHGTVSCVVVYSYTERGGVAVIGGQSRTGEDFRFDVVDGGDQGTDSALCDREDEQAETDVARGNVQVHKAKAAEGGQTQGKGGKPSAL